MGKITRLGGPMEAGVQMPVTELRGGVSIDLIGGALHAGGGSLGEATPADHDLISWSFDPAGTEAATVTVSGSLYLVKQQFRAPAVISDLLWLVSTVATTPTGGQNFVGLYSPAGTRLASVGVDSDITTTGVKTTTVGPVKVPAGFVWAAFLFNAVTPPQMHRSQTGLLNRHNVGLPVERYRFARAGTGLTSLPASIDPAANTGGTVAPAWWAAIR